MDEKIQREYFDLEERIPPPMVIMGVLCLSAHDRKRLEAFRAADVARTAALARGYLKSYAIVDTA